MSDDNPCPDCWQLVQEKQELREKLARLRECAFDEDVTHILENVAKWFEDDSADALAECLRDVRDILVEAATG